MTLTMNFKVTKIKYNHIDGLPIYTYHAVMFNSNIWHNSPPLRDIMLQNMSDRDFHLSRSLKQGHMWYCHWTPHICVPINV